MLDAVAAVMGAAKGNPEALMDHMVRSNPQFAQFVRQSQGLSMEQVARNLGMSDSDISTLRGMIGG